MTHESWKTYQMSTVKKYRKWIGSSCRIRNKKRKRSLKIPKRRRKGTCSTGKKKLAICTSSRHKTLWKLLKRNRTRKNNSTICKGKRSNFSKKLTNSILKRSKPKRSTSLLSVCLWRTSLKPWVNLLTKGSITDPVLSFQKAKRPTSQCSEKAIHYRKVWNCRTPMWTKQSSRWFWNSWRKWKEVKLKHLDEWALVLDYFFCLFAFNTIAWLQFG